MPTFLYHDQSPCNPAELLYSINSRQSNSLSLPSFCAVTFVCLTKGFIFANESSVASPFSEKLTSLPPLKMNEELLCIPLHILAGYPWSRCCPRSFSLHLFCPHQVVNIVCKQNSVQPPLSRTDYAWKWISLLQRQFPLSRWFRRRVRFGVTDRTHTLQAQGCK